MAAGLAVFHRSGRITLVSFIVLGLIVLGIGTLLLFVSFDVLSGAGWAALVIGIPALAAVVLASSLVQERMALLKPAHVSVDETVRYFEEGVLRAEIPLDEATRIDPLVNHALGYNAFFGLAVRRGRTTISMSPDEGWSLSDLREGVPAVLAAARRHGCRISKDFGRVRY